MCRKSVAPHCYFNLKNLRVVTVMAIDTETFRWIVGGYFIVMSSLTALAYKDPDFFVHWVHIKLSAASLISFWTITVFLVGAKMVKDYVMNHLWSFIPILQQQEFLKSYESSTSVLTWVIIGTVLTFIWVQIMHSISIARKRHLSK